jgi:N-acetylglucosaminyldiphosphoundecaprenol N-acetyl-beta-D-mannosaminyltransferase
MVLPDGAPVVWISRLRGERKIRRVCGPDFILKLAERSTSLGWRHFFYGGAASVADELARRLQERYSGLIVAGVETPPFRDLTEQELAAAMQRIQHASPSIIWIGLGCPKQEIWMHQNAYKLPGVMIGVGAAFDFHSGRIKRAPKWMRTFGLEWLHRLLSEPRRLWRRYLYLAPRFIVLNIVGAFLKRIHAIESATSPH